MTATAAAEAAVLPLAADVDLPAWAAWLKDRCDPRWRPTEWASAAWLFTGDLDNPATTSQKCAVLSCTVIVSSNGPCCTCLRAFHKSGLDRATFLTTYQPPPPQRRPRGGELCIVTRDGRTCQRPQAGSGTGLCYSHYSCWTGTTARHKYTPQEWAVTRARPLDSLGQCIVTGCEDLQGTSYQLCPLHYDRWRRARRADDLPRTPGVITQWAATQQPRLNTHQFSLITLSETVRLELLFAMQSRDDRGGRIDPQGVRKMVQALTGTTTITAFTPSSLSVLCHGDANGRAHARELVRAVHRGFELFAGVDPTRKEVWDLVAVGLPSRASQTGRRVNPGFVDFTVLQQRWLRELALEWARTARPDSQDLKQTVQACGVASRTLAARPGGGHDLRALKFADMTQVFTSFTQLRRDDGNIFGLQHRRHLLARFHNVLDFGRANDMLGDLPASFARHPSHRFPPEEANEDEIGKAIPEPVIAQLDAQLHLIGRNQVYGRGRPQADVQMLLETVYKVLRDTGRRPLEIASLPVDCLETDGDNDILVYDNYKARRLRRRLPITASTAQTIRDWQAYRADLDIPERARPWLFPAITNRKGRGHMETNHISVVFRAWVDLIPVLNSDVPGPDGSPLPFDRSLVFPYAFRFSYAQRHADAGVPVEILKELMDHKNVQTTLGYYKISMKRKLEAIKTMSQYVRDRTGSPVPQPADATSYELRSVGAPFGNCIEPSNVRAGGKQCPIRFQCAGCGYYRPDPSYLPAIEEQINTLKADRETALAMDVDDFVVRNLAEQIRAFTGVQEEMHRLLEGLPADQRAEIEDASKILRRARAARQLPLIVLPGPRSQP